MRSKLLSSEDWATRKIGNYSGVEGLFAHLQSIDALHENVNILERKVEVPTTPGTIEQVLQGEPEHLLGTNSIVVRPAGLEPAPPA